MVIISGSAAHLVPTPTTIQLRGISKIILCPALLETIESTRAFHPPPPPSHTPQAVKVRDCLLESLAEHVRVGCVEALESENGRWTEQNLMKHLPAKKVLR